MSVQLINVIGIVKDVETGEPITGVTVTRVIGNNPDTGSYVQTGAQGNFNIPIANIDGLRFSHAEYQTEDYTNGQLFANTNIVQMVKKNKVLPGVTLAAGNAWVLWLLGGGALLWYFNKKKNRRSSKRR